MPKVSSRKERLRIYKVAWLPIAGLLIYLLASRGGMSWIEATVLALPLSALGQFISLSAWYSCRITPLQRSPVLNLILTHLIAAQILSFLWVGAAKLLAHLLSLLNSLQKLEAHFSGEVWPLYWTGCILYLLSVAFHYVALAQDASRDAESRALEATVLARDAELKALKAQIDPHFIFNSLNSISALTTIDPARAREMCILLADFLRMTLGLGEKTSIPLSEELSLLDRFLAIEKVRFGARLKMEEEIQEEARACLIPPLILQPLVENAITHGIATLPEGGHLKLSAQRNAGRLSLQVENSYDSEAAPTKRGGLGLKNVQQRLEARFGKEANLRIAAEEDRFQVSLFMPATAEEKAQ